MTLYPLAALLLAAGASAGEVRTTLPKGRPAPTVAAGTKAVPKLELSLSGTVPSALVPALAPAARAALPQVSAPSLAPDIPLAVAALQPAPQAAQLALPLEGGIGILSADDAAAALKGDELSKLFDGSLEKSGAVSVEYAPLVDSVNRLRKAGPGDAPKIYKQALERAQALGVRRAFERRLIKELAPRGAQAVPTIIEAALKLAGMGKLQDPVRRLAMEKATFWNEILFKSGSGHYVNLGITDSLLAAINAESEKGKKAPYELQIQENGANLSLVFIHSAAAKKNPPAPSAYAGGTVASKAKEWLANAFDGAVLEWKKLWSAQPEETAAPVFDPPQAPSSSSEDVLVHAPRRFGGTALGYRLYHAAPDGFPAEEAKDEAVRLEVTRTGRSKELDELRARFEVFNALIESNFAALELIAQGSTKMTVKNARAVLAKVQDMATAYAALTDSQRSKRFRAAVDAIGRRLEKQLAGLSDGETLSVAAADLVVPIEKESLHKYVNLLHQAALDAVGKRGDDDEAAPASNLRLGLVVGDDRRREVSLVDLSENPLTKDGRVVSPTLKALTRALLRARDTPKGSLVMQDHQFWGHFKLGAHSAEVYASFLPPDEGGIVRVRYQEWGDNLANQSRLYYVAKILERLGFAVEQESGFLTAVVDKDHGAQNVDRMMESFGVLLQALHSTVGVDYALPKILEGSKTPEESARRIDQWVDIVMGEGELPFYKHDDHDSMVAGWREHVRQAPLRLHLRQSLNNTLEKLGLPKIPDDESLGQLTIDRRYNEPIEEALARGDFHLRPDGSFSRPKRDPLEQAVARLLDGAMPARMAEVVASLDPDLFTFKTIGAVGSLHVQRAQRKLDSDSWLILTVLRDPQSGQLVSARAELGRLDRLPAPLGPKALFAALEEQGYPVAAFEPNASPEGFAALQRKAREPARPNPGIGESATGLAASPGHGRPVVARLTYDKEKAARGGYVFVAPYTTPDDLDAIRSAKAVLTTSGGLLSHAAITTREMGIPAVILGQAVWQGKAAALETPSFGRARKTEGGLEVSGVVSTRRAPLAEDSVVRIDPATGVVETYPAAVSAAMLELSRELERGDDRALAEWAARRLPKLGTVERFAVTHELLRALAARDDSAVATVRRLLPQDRWSGQVESMVFAQQARQALEAVREAAEAARESFSVESVERAIVRGAAAVDRITGLALALERPADELKLVNHARQALEQQGKARLAKLMADDIAELEEHARTFPSLTAQTLPRIKALVAKAKRRNLAPELYARWEAQLKKLESARRSRAVPAVLSLADVLDVDVPFVGGKAAKLGEIMQVVKAAGGEVPPGLALSVQAYRDFLKQAGIAERVETIAANRILKPEAKSEMIQKLILQAPLSKNSGLGQLIMRSLKTSAMEGKMLAVRSSAVDEDGAEAAFAGAGDTHLYVSSEQLLDHVKQVWASLWNPRALLYREMKGLTTTNLAQAVVIQVMADSEISGIAFTQDPVSGNSGRVIVNAVWGLGEGAVSGRVAPDQYVLSKKTGREVLPAMIADKKHAVIRDPRTGAGTIDKKVEPRLRRARAMTPDKLEKLARVGAAIERHFGYGLDIEWGYVGNTLYILQARPITQAKEPEKKKKKVLFVCTGNTCRSAMAEYIARDKLAKSGRTDLEFVSRGLQARDGDMVSDGARVVLRAYGVDGSEHEARMLRPQDVAGADVILAMTPEHARRIVDLYPSAEHKVRTLAEHAIEDPFGSDLARYKSAAGQIEAAVDLLLR